MNIGVEIELIDGEGERDECFLKRAKFLSIPGIVERLFGMSQLVSQICYASLENASEVTGNKCAAYT